LSPLFNPNASEGQRRFDCGGFGREEQHNHCEEGDPGKEIQPLFKSNAEERKPQSGTPTLKNQKSNPRLSADLLSDHRSVNGKKGKGRKGERMVSSKLGMQPRTRHHQAT